jgi:hypothetical protein
MTSMAEQPFIAAAFDPRLAPADPLAASWLAEVTLRLRRELAWSWHLSGPVPGAPLPPARDAVVDAVDRLRHHAEHERFLAEDPAARYLGEQIALVRRLRGDIDAAARGRSRWGRAVERTGLDDAAQFVLALALAARIDPALAPVAAACQGEAVRSPVTLALAQRLWDEPLALLACTDPAHALYRQGWLRPPGADPWTAALDLPAPLAPLLLDPGAPLPPALMQLAATAPVPNADHAAAIAWLQARPPHTLQVVPLRLPPAGDPAAAAALAAAAGGALTALAPDLAPDHPAVPGLAAAAVLAGCDLLLPEAWSDHEGHLPLAQALAPLAALPLRCWLPLADAQALRGVPAGWLTPSFTLPALPLAERRRRLAEALPEAMGGAALEAARRYRLGERALAQVTAALRRQPPADEAALGALCRAAARVELDALAQPVQPRFALGEMVLPPRQQAQLHAIADAMRQLARVHHEWGTARVWNEGGLAVLFCGPPGTGKTMAAEALAHELALPMVRVDLSQVVDKYVGETEKNLKRVFDAAEAAEGLLFFDEADALFGKRTEVKDAHDRYANLEVSYLLERMERFKGLAVLASNRRKDLDEAFARRLRFVVEFPLPGPEERERLWRSVFPSSVDVSALDLGFVARRFEMAGGPIRSAAFNACLHAAAESCDAARVTMAQLLLAVKRELDKAGRETQREQFGAYAALLPAHA